MAILKSYENMKYKLINKFIFVFRGHLNFRLLIIMLCQQKKSID